MPAQSRSKSMPRTTSKPPLKASESSSSAASRKAAPAAKPTAPSKGNARVASARKGSLRQQRSKDDDNKPEDCENNTAQACSSSKGGGRPGWNSDFTTPDKDDTVTARRAKATGYEERRQKLAAEKEMVKKWTGGLRGELHADDQPGFVFTMDDDETATKKKVLNRWPAKPIANDAELVEKWKSSLRPGFD